MRIAKALNIGTTQAVRAAIIRRRAGNLPKTRTTCGRAALSSTPRHLPRSALPGPRMACRFRLPPPASRVENQPINESLTEHLTPTHML
jgi:hypothetical protein